MIPLTNFRAVIFDFDGVLVDSETLQARAWTQLASELGSPRTVAVSEIAGKLDRHLAPALFPSHDPVFSASRKQSIERDMEAAGGLRCVAETIDFARRVAVTHTLAVCSSSRPERINRLLSHFEVGGLFSVIVGQVAGEDCKPSPAPYLKALRLLGLSATDACAIEDSATGIAAAKAAGLYTFQLLHDGMPVCPAADTIIRSCAELS